MNKFRRKMNGWVPEILPGAFGVGYCYNGLKHETRDGDAICGARIDPIGKPVLLPADEDGECDVARCADCFPWSAQPAKEPEEQPAKEPESLWFAFAGEVKR